MRFRPAIHLALGATMGVLALSLATARELSGLVKNNPFGAAQMPIQKPAEPMIRWELRGVIRESVSGYLLNVYDTQTKKSAWVREGEGGQVLRVHQFNKADGTAVVEADDRMFSLTLKIFRDGAPRPAVAALAAALGTPVKTQAMLGAVTPPESEVQRLESVAQEIRMRRELRKQSTLENPQT